MTHTATTDATRTPYSPILSDLYTRKDGDRGPQSTGRGPPSRRPLCRDSSRRQLYTSSRQRPDASRARPSGRPSIYASSASSS